MQKEHKKMQSQSYLETAFNKEIVLEDAILDLTSFR